MLTIYPACFFKENDAYSVVFPDLNWLSTCGDTLESAVEAAVDCLAGYLYLSAKNGDSIPEPSTIQQININSVADELKISPDESFVNMISVDVAAYAKEHYEKAIKKTLTIPAWLNQAALEMNINFSQVLQEALLAKIQKQTKF